MFVSSIPSHSLHQQYRILCFTQQVTIHLILTSVIQLKSAQKLIFVNYRTDCMTVPEPGNIIIYQTWHTTLPKKCKYYLQLPVDMLLLTTITVKHHCCILVPIILSNSLSASHLTVNTSMAK
jgi:hypothetical protein